MSCEWQLVPSTGKPPYVTEGCAAVVHGDHLYVFGGYSEGEGDEEDDNEEAEGTSDEAEDSEEVFDIVGAGPHEVCAVGMVLSGCQGMHSIERCCRPTYHICRVFRPFIHEKVRKSMNKCESEENRELRIGTKMYEYVRIVGMMDMAILPI